MQRKSVLSMAALMAAILVAVLTPRPAAAACFCLAERFNATGSSTGSSCFEAQSNLINNLNFAANQSCISRGYSGACNVVIRTGVCSPDPYWPGNYRLDGTAKYSCSLC
ncbi:MAG TPA: hypothetical protein VF789_09225 [Thermoanaerobaculia bacterium]